MTDYIVLIHINHDGEDYPEGSTITLSEHDATFLLMVGIVREKTAADVPPDNESPATETESPEAQTPAPEPEPEPEPANYADWLNADLEAELDSRGIDYPSNAVKADMVALLEADDAAKAAE